MNVKIKKSTLKKERKKLITREKKRKKRFG